MEPNTSQLPIATSAEQGSPQGERLLVASRLASALAGAQQPVEVGVNGRVARSGRAMMVNDTRLDSDYLTRNPQIDPGSELSLPIPVAGTTWGVMNLEQQECDAFGDEDLLLAHVVATQLGSAIHRCQLVGELERAFLTTIGVLADAVELQDAYTGEHSNEVAELAVRVGRRLGTSSTASATEPSSTTSARSVSPASCCASPAR